MAEVYAAEDLVLGERVALKVLSAHRSASRNMPARLKREIQLARQISHPNVCRIFDIGFHRENRQAKSIAFVSMELLDGESLSARLRRTGPIAPAEALPLVEQMVAGLNAAHQMSVVHRDFKSGNVVLVPAPERRGGYRMVIVDFGLARRLIPESPALLCTLVGGRIGTPGYMAPEQRLGQPAGRTADVYALGVVLFEMLTGRLPFLYESAQSPEERPAPPPRPSALVSQLDPRWDSVILRCLEYDPAARFQDVSVVTHKLRGMIRSREPSRPRRNKGRRPRASEPPKPAPQAAPYRARRLRSLPSALGRPAPPRPHAPLLLAGLLLLMILIGIALVRWRMARS
jgi:serine/threonine protein kinase